MGGESKRRGTKQERAFQAEARKLMHMPAREALAEAIQLGQVKFSLEVPTMTPLQAQIRRYTRLFKESFPAVMEQAGIKGPWDPRWQMWFERLYRPLLEPTQEQAAQDGPTMKLVLEV